MKHQRSPKNDIKMTNRYLELMAQDFPKKSDMGSAKKPMILGMVSDEFSYLNAEGETKHYDIYYLDKIIAKTKKKLLI